METVLTKIVLTLQPGEMMVLYMPASQDLHVEEAYGRDVWAMYEGKAGGEWLYTSGSVTTKRDEETVVLVDPKVLGPVALAVEATDGHMSRKSWYTMNGWCHTLTALSWNEYADTPIAAA